MNTLADMAPVFDALGSATRRRILDLIKAEPGCTVGHLASHFDTTRIAVMHHLRQLEECDLVVSRRDGRTRRLFHNPVPIQLIYDRWTSEYSGFWASKMADVKYAVEHGHQQGSDKYGGQGASGIENPDSGSDRGRVA